jgi:hypothetical protein
MVPSFHVGQFHIPQPLGDQVHQRVFPALLASLILREYVKDDSTVIQKDV